MEAGGNFPVTSVVQAFHLVHVNLLVLFSFVLGFTCNFQLSYYGWIPMVELKLAIFLIHLLYKKPHTLFPNICAGTKIPVRNPMATDI